MAATAADYVIDRLGAWGVARAIVDPDAPPIPPHVTFDQAAPMTKALLKGDPDATGVIRHSLREVAATVASRSP
jgi:hypothetical protein